MADNTNGRNYPEPRFDSFISKATSRRQFIKGVIFSGAELGGTGGSALAVDLIQVGSEFPGEDLTINISL